MKTGNEAVPGRTSNLESPRFFHVVQFAAILRDLDFPPEEAEDIKGFRKLFFLAPGSLAPPNPGRWRCQSDAWPFSWAMGGKSCLMSPQ